jgi:hypothetical protein
LCKELSPPLSGNTSQTGEIKTSLEVWAEEKEEALVHQVIKILFPATHYPVDLTGTPDQVRLSGLPDSEWLA